MAYIERGGVRQVITASVGAFRVRIAELQKELKECEEEREKFLQGIKAARKRTYLSKQSSSALRLRMEDVTVKIDRTERNLENAKDRLYRANRKTQDNIEVLKSLEKPQPDLEELAETIHKANKFAALMRSKKAGAAKKIEELEDKIQRAERRFQKADDFIYTIQQKMATHRRLMDNPVVSTNYKPMKQDEYAEKVSALKEKIRLAAARTRKATNAAAHLDKRLEIMENAMDNYDRRISDFQQSKREIMGSK
ncbi:tropomyosin [Exaiptasia diaphana]|uniref:Uncharacterized protein n=1 Tax=Exaiptasia diaphana TaxID=2652724 RepID=A0A913WX22_EXADI|nr:tropomyosin [Exaiptasia diaphana]KXJ27649.1 hypothetical protein AC249_AIPGENE16906 [Exaiptasia diaphana]